MILEYQRKGIYDVKLDDYYRENIDYENIKDLFNGTLKHDFYRIGYGHIPPNIDKLIKLHTLVSKTQTYRPSKMLITNSKC